MSDDQAPMNQAAQLADAPDRPAVEPTTRRLPAASGFLPAAAAVLATLWVFRGVLFGGKLPGDIGDARWTIALHEHWYRVWTGAESVRDLHYYYPLPNTLGTSDAYLVQGLLYSLARIVGFGLVGSWVIACVGIFLIGALGVAVLSRQLLAAVATQVAFVIACCASYAVFAGYGHVQLFGMLAVSWIFVGLHDLVGRRHVRRGIALLVLVPPLLALSSWYPVVLAAIVLAVLAAALALVSSAAGIARTVGRVAADLWQTLRSVVGVAMAVLFVALWAAVLWVYLPARGLLPKPDWGEVVLYSPRWSDIWNATGAGGGIWSGLYARLPELGLANSEQQYGFTPILFLVFAAVGLWLFRLAVLSGASPARKAGDRPAVGRGGLLAACLTVIGVLALILIDERGLSFYRILWFHVPGLESVRAPFRVMEILYPVALFVVMRSFELAWRSNWVRRVSWRRTVFVVAAGALALLMVVEMQRTPDDHWTAAELLRPELLAQVEPARASCDAVILLDENGTDPVWVNPIEAVIFSSISGIPTPQGYSRANPIDYPDPDAAGYGPGSLVTWMQMHGFHGRTCTVSGGGVQPLGG